MRNRMTLAAPSIVVLVVAASSLSMQPGSAQTAKAKDQAKADECQSRPGASTPRGSHWFYRLDRQSGRRCWYLGPANQKMRQAAPTEQAPAERRAATTPLPRPNALRADEETEIPANATAANTVDAEAPATTAATNAGSAAANQFSAGWPAVADGAVSSDRDVTTAFADNTDANVNEAATAETPPEDMSQADMPMVWPVLASNEHATTAQASEPAPGLGHLLIFLAATVAFVAIAVRAMLKLLSLSRGRSRPMAPAARAAAPVIRPRAPGSPATPEATTAPAVARLREVAKRWETPARVPRQPRIPAYEVMSEYKEQTPPVRRRAVA
jgi:hypothetical protein